MTVVPLPQGREEQTEVLEAEDDEKKESEVDERSKREPLNERMRHGYDREME